MWKRGSVEALKRKDIHRREAAIHLIAAADLEGLQAAGCSQTLSE
jgi:hypothetical protein